MSDPSAQSSSDLYSEPVTKEPESRKDFTVSEVVERLGFTTHHWQIVSFVWCVWAFYGWSFTLLVFAMDAAGEDGSDWTRLTSPRDKLTVEDKSWCFLIGGMLGVFAVPLVSFISDVYGRIAALEAGVIGTIVVMIACALARSRIALLFLLCIYPAGGPPLITQSLLSEWLPVEWRGILSTSLHAVWNVGRLAITIVWILLPPLEHWTAFFLVVAIPPLLLATFTRFRGWRYESPRILAVTGNAEACLELLKLAAESDKEQKPAFFYNLENPHNLRLDDSSGQTVQVQHKSWTDQLSELLVPQFRLPLAIIGIISFAISFAGMVIFVWFMEYLKYIGMTAAIGPCMVAAPLGKIFSNILLVMGGRNSCMIDRYPRVLIMQVGLFGCASSFAGFFVCKSVIAITIVVFGSQIFEEFAWTAQSIYLVEAFPTTVRNTAQGLIGAVCGLGSLIGSAAGGLLMELWVYLPIVMMMGTLLLGGVSGFFLSEEHCQDTLTDTVSCEASRLLLSKERYHETGTEPVSYAACDLALKSTRP